MFETVSEALTTINEYTKNPVGEDTYREACLYAVRNRDTLTQKVYIRLPGGRSGNQDPAWEEIKQNSQERCGCGNERVILPAHQRTDYESSESGTVLVSPEHSAYIKPIGGDEASALVLLHIEDGLLAFLMEPLAPLVFSIDVLFTKGFDLRKLAEMLPAQTTPPIFKTGKDGIPICAIHAVDLETKTVTIVLDRGVETFTPEKSKTHDC